MNGRRVVVTGMGVRTPAGCDLDGFWRTVLAGDSVAGPISRFDASEFRVRFACEVRSFDPTDRIDVKSTRRMDRVTQLSVSAAIDAIDDAQGVSASPDRCGVVFGTGTGGCGTMYEQLQVLLSKGPERVSPFLVPMMMPNATPAFISMLHKWTGPSFAVSSACTSSANAIGEAARLVTHGDADVVVAGGGESGIEAYAFAAFARMGALSTRNDDPTAASRPFDADRDGYVMSEGASFVVLEDLEGAVTRGARIYAELVGYGRNSDAFHITAPSPDGRGAGACMDLALRDAGMAAGELMHVNAHGTSTELNDLTEGLAIARTIDGKRGSRVPVTSSKSVYGHLMGGGGATEAVTAVLSMRAGVIPPTANHTRLDPRLDIDVVTEPRRVASGPTMSNSFGFGGHNASLVFSPFEAA